MMKSILIRPKSRWRLLRTAADCTGRFAKVALNAASSVRRLSQTGSRPAAEEGANSPESVQKLVQRVAQLIAATRPALIKPDFMSR
jgi:2,4-dienoyl-CoA reductase-like NADH-dependent reductase (Old Yellow Enzyme family)